MIQCLNQSIQISSSSIGFVDACQNTLGLSCRSLTLVADGGLPVCSGETDGGESSAQNTSLPGGQSGVPANVVHAADGSHLDALVPKRANGPPGNLLHHPCVLFIKFLDPFNSGSKCLANLITMEAVSCAPSKPSQSWNHRQPLSSLNYLSWSYQYSQQSQTCCQNLWITEGVIPC